MKTRTEQSVEHARPASLLANLEARPVRVGGQVLAAVFSIWLCGLVLAGLGAIPVDLPASGVVRALQEPPRIGAAPEHRGDTPSRPRHRGSAVTRTSRSNAKHRSAARRPAAGAPRRARDPAGKPKPRSAPSPRSSRGAQ